MNGCVCVLSPTFSRAWYAPGGSRMPVLPADVPDEAVDALVLGHASGRRRPDRGRRRVLPSCRDRCSPPPRPRRARPAPPRPLAAGASLLYELTTPPFASRMSIVTGPAGADGEVVLDRSARAWPALTRVR